MTLSTVLSKNGDVLIYSLTANPLSAARIIEDWSTQILTNAYFAVDTFFFMSGLLVAFMWFKVIAFYTFVFRTFIKNMPNLLYHLPDSCEENWWTNFIYLNNYIDYANQCYLISWYLATDLQMYIFSPIILIPLAIKPLLGFIIAVLILLASTAANMATIYKYYFPPSDYALGAMDPRMKDLNKYTLLIYGAPWIRCQIYIIGMLTGYLLQTKKELHINRIVNIALWVISLALGALVVFSSDKRVYVLVDLDSIWSTHLLGLFDSLLCGVLLHWHEQRAVHVVSFILPAIALTYFFAIFWSAVIEISTGKIETIFLGDARKGSQPVIQEIPNKIFAYGNHLSLQLPHLRPPPSHPPQRNKPRAVHDISMNGAVHQFAPQYSRELASGIKSSRRRRKEPVDPMETPAVDDWM
uniref:Acyltransferase 3 domain-containing protein n=1 Tax=Parascaris equorum TaxID=6256 RepID=A0A914RP72_PAREQ